MSEVFEQEIDPVMRKLGYCCGRKVKMFYIINSFCVWTLFFCLMFCLGTNLYTYCCAFSIYFTPKCCVVMESTCVQFQEMLLTGRIKIGMFFGSDRRLSYWNVSKTTSVTFQTSPGFWQEGVRTLKARLLNVESYIHAGL